MLLSLPLPALPALACGNRAPKKCGLVQFCTCLPRRTLCSPSLSPASLPRPGGGWSRCLLLGLGSCFPRDTGCLVASVAGLPCLPTASEGATRPMLLGFPRPSRRWTRLPVLIRGSRAPAKFGLCHFAMLLPALPRGKRAPTKCGLVHFLLVHLPCRQLLCMACTHVAPACCTALGEQSPNKVWTCHFFAVCGLLACLPTCTSLREQSPHNMWTCHFFACVACAHIKGVVVTPAFYPLVAASSCTALPALMLQPPTLVGLVNLPCSLCHALSAPSSSSLGKQSPARVPWTLFISRALTDLCIFLACCCCLPSKLPLSPLLLACLPPVAQAPCIAALECGLSLFLMQCWPDLCILPSIPCLAPQQSLHNRACTSVDLVFFTCIDRRLSLADTPPCTRGHRAFCPLCKPAYSPAAVIKLARGGNRTHVRAVRRSPHHEWTCHKKKIEIYRELRKKQ